jgi:GSH-dependent disulfide-bond oxidoreductase
LVVGTRLEAPAKGKDFHPSQATCTKYEKAMIDLYFWPTPNGHKISIFLEEADVPYALHPVDIGAGDQLKPEFLAKSPNNRIPAIVDHAPKDGGAPISVFESGAILLYLATKYQKFLPEDLRARTQVTEWLMWQMGGLGPMLGQTHHFLHYAPEKVPYAMDRYRKETSRLYGVLNQRLASREYIVDDYSIADMAAWPWIMPEMQGQALSDFPHLKRWHETLSQRPNLVKGHGVGKELRKPMTEAAKKVLFGQTNELAPSKTE